MPWGHSKSEIVRQADELVAQLKNKTYHSPFARDFAEVYIEGGNGPERNGPASPGAPVPQRPADPIRGRFMQMRRIARRSRAAGSLSGSGDGLQAVSFYKQAKFMEDFEDDYGGNAPLLMYFPTYDRMSYEQLRTYFTWRGRVRKGEVRKTSFSYVFLYLYELINRVGVRDCVDGMEKLAFVWEKYRVYEKKLDVYMNEWVKDYYITNEFSAPFGEILQKTGNLRKFYRPSAAESLLNFYAPYSDYKIKKSRFYTPETAKKIDACFRDVAGSLDDFLRGQGGEFEDLIFYSKSNTWVPFSRALYCSFCGQAANRTVQISETERYRCENGRWTSSRYKISKENGRLLLGYIFRRIEQFYRKAAKYRYKLTADRGKISAEALRPLVPDPERLFRRIDSAILEHDRRSRRKIVTVDAARVESIRESAFRTQEKLLASDGEEARADEARTAAALETERPATAEEADRQPAAGDGWEAFARSLDGTETAAVRMILQGASLPDLHACCRNAGTMLEVLVDKINQKAMDAVQDSVIELSDRIAVFDEYKNDLKRVIRIECR